MPPIKPKTPPAGKRIVPSEAVPTTISKCKIPSIIAIFMNINAYWRNPKGTLR